MGTVVITGVGMCSSLGDVATACAAARAGLSCPGELEFAVPDVEDEEVVSVSGHPVPSLAPFRGRGRLIALAEQGLDDLLAQHPGLRRTEGLGLHLCLTDPETRRWAPEPGEQRESGGQHGERERMREAAGARLSLAADIAALAQLRIDRAHYRVYANGPAGMAAAIENAVQLLDGRQLSACLIGAVDSQIDRPTLQFLHEAGRLKGPEEPNGLMPGEAACFVLLERRDSARHQSRRPLGYVSATAVAQGVDPDTIDHPPRGTALLDLFARMGKGGRSGSGAFWFLTDQNGEVFRALEWADFTLRASHQYPEVAQAPLWYPAVAFGDTGAASGAVAIGMAVRAFARGYAPAPSAIVLSSTYEGLRAAVRIDAPGAS